MLINITTLRERIHGVILNKGEQGHEIEGHKSIIHVEKSMAF